MTNKELMLGDWVKLKIFSQIPTYTPKQIEASDFARNLNIKPIPLSTEILERNGFVKSENNKWSYYDFEGEIKIDYWRTGGEPDSVMAITMNYGTDEEFTYELPEPYYVHELQHSLRLCGLIKLVDNLIL